MTLVPVPTLGGFKVQYTPTAQSLIDGLKPNLRKRLVQYMTGIAEANPYAQSELGTPPLGPDRRSLTFQNVTVTFWVSNEVKMVTVVDVVTSEDK